MTPIQSILAHLGGTIALITVLWPSQSAVPTYHKDIAPIIRRSCIPCHAPDGHGPFELTEYEHIQKRLKLFRTVTLNRQMPPYRAESDFGPMLVQPAIGDEDLVTVQRWIQAGAPEGEAIPAPPIEQPPTPTASRSIEVGEEAVVKAEGRPYWIAYPIQNNEEILSSGAQITTKAPHAVRRVLVARSLSAHASNAPIETAGEIPVYHEPLLTWSAGQQAIANLGATVVIPRARLWVQVLYVPTGKPDPAAIRLDFSPPAGPIATPLPFIQSVIEVPPKKDREYEVAKVLNEATQVWAVIPFARFFATQIIVKADIPGIGTKTLLHLNAWRPFWIGSYNLSKAVMLPAQTRISVTISYDNGEHTPTNEGKKPKMVVRGLQADNETFSVYLLTSPQNGLE